MLQGRQGFFGQQLRDGGVEQPCNGVHHCERGKDIAGLAARHGQGVDFEVFGELFLSQANGRDGGLQCRDPNGWPATDEWVLP